MAPEAYARQFALARRIEAAAARVAAAVSAAEAAHTRLAAGGPADLDLRLQALLGPDFGGAPVAPPPPGLTPLRTLAGKLSAIPGRRGRRGRAAFAGRGGGLRADRARGGGALWPRGRRCRLRCRPRLERMTRAAGVFALAVALLPAAAGAGVPDVFDVRLETSKGPIVIEVHREWAPIGAARFHDLVRSRYYDDTRIFRVVAGRWAQFGIHGDPRVSARWRHRTIPDDPPRVSNTRGTVAFAFAVPNGRTTQVFISLSDYTALDAQGSHPSAA